MCLASGRIPTSISVARGHPAVPRLNGPLFFLHVVLSSSYGSVPHTVLVHGPRVCAQDAPSALGPSSTVHCPCGSETAKGESSCLFHGHNVSHGLHFVSRTALSLLGRSPTCKRMTTCVCRRTRVAGVLLRLLRLQSSATLACGFWGVSVWFGRHRRG